MRCDGKPVRPGIRTPHRMSKAESLSCRMGPGSRTPSGPAVLQRLHRQAEDKTASDPSRHIKSSLATREPSRQDIDRIQQAACMRMYALAAATFVIAAACAPSRGQSADITIVHRFTGLACGGLCVDEIVTVSIDGHVRWQLEDPAALQLQVSALRARTPPTEFLASHQAAAAFAQQLSAVKPNADLADPSGCDAPGHVKDVWDWEIQWTSPKPARRLRTCDSNQLVLGAWRKAIAALGMPQGLAGDLKPGVKRLAPSP